jgi:nucleoside-diphosphate-sugar epimerase
MTKIVITGIAGALGSAIARISLKKGYEVEGFEILPIHNAWRLADLRDQIVYHWKSVHDIAWEDLKDANIVCHCCAQADRPMGINSPVYTLELNIMALARVLEACRHVKLEKFLFPGSGTTFTGVPTYELPVTEKTVPEPTNPYSASKYMAEILCRTYHKCYGVPIVILRSGLVYGPGMRLDISIAQFIMKLLSQTPVIVRSPGTTRTPTYIDDVLLYWNAIIDAPAAEVVGETFHSVYGKEYSVMEIAETVCKVLGVEASVLEAGAYEPGEGTKENPLREWTVSTKDKLLDVQPKIDLEEGVKLTVPYIKEACKI